MFVRRLYWNATCSTTHHGHPPPELRGVKTMAHPGWSSFQWLSKTFPSTSTLRAFLSSNRFLTTHVVPADVGAEPELPDVPVSTNSVAATFQRIVWTPAVRP